MMMQQPPQQANQLFSVSVPDVAAGSSPKRLWSWLAPADGQVPSGFIYVGQMPSDASDARVVVDLWVNGKKAHSASLVAGQNPNVLGGPVKKLDLVEAFISTFTDRLVDGVPAPPPIVTVKGIHICFEFVR